MSNLLRLNISLALTVLACAGCTDNGGGSGQVTSSTVAPDPFVPTMAIRRVATRKVGLQGLTAIALDSGGQRYLAHAGGIAVFDPGWKRAVDMPTEKPAVGVAVHEDGRVFVALRQQVVVFDASGKETARWGTPGNQEGQLLFMTGIAVGESDVWLADMGNRVIHRFDATGDFVSDFAGGDPATGTGGIICPSAYLDCTVGPDGTLYNSNPGEWRVEHYDLNGRLLGQWGKRGSRAEQFQGCCNPTNLAIRPGGGFVTSEKGAVPRLKIHDAAGTVLAVAGPEHFSTNAAGLDMAVAADGRIHVIDPGAGAVLEFEVETLK